MPNTIGVIDCTHVHLQAPREKEWEFVNRKGRHSINVQLVGNADLIITNCVVRWPGSVHDARILRESRFYRNLQQNPPDGIILGDSAYPLLPWLITPFSMPNNAAEEGFVRICGSEPFVMAGQCLYVLFIFWFCFALAEVCCFLSRSPVWVFVCHACHCVVVTLREFPGLAGFPSPPSFS